MPFVAHVTNLPTIHYLFFKNAFYVQCEPPENGNTAYHYLTLNILNFCKVNSYVSGVYVCFSIHHLHAIKNLSPFLCIYYTRLSQRNAIDVVYPSSTHSRQSSVFMGAKVWNGIPLEIREHTTCDGILLHYKRYLRILQSDTRGSG